MTDDNRPDVVIQTDQLVLGNHEKTPAQRNAAGFDALTEILARANQATSLIVQIIAIASVAAYTTPPPLTSGEALLRPYDAQMTDDLGAPANIPLDNPPGAQ